MYGLRGANALLRGENERYKLLAPKNARTTPLLAYDDEEPKARRKGGPKARGKTAATDRAARAYLEEGLGWLRGYPESALPPDAHVPWRFPGKDGQWVTLAVDRELLRTSFYTLRGARRKFPHALERVVGDITAWSDRMEERLRRIQGLVHSGEPLFAGESPEPHAAPISSAEIHWLTWGDLTHPRRMEINRRHWGAALAQVGTSLGIATARRLGLEVVLSLEDPAALDPLRAVLLHPAAYTVATEAGPVLDVVKALTSKKLTSAGVESRLDALAQPAGASPLARQVIDLLLEEADPLARRLVLGCISPTICDAWEAWWASVTTCRRDAEALQRLTALEVGDKRVTKGLISKVRASAILAADSVPLPTSISQLARTVQNGLERLPRPSAEQLLRCLVQLPKGPSTDLKNFLESATQRVYGLSERRRAELLTGLAERLESCAHVSDGPELRSTFALLVVEHIIDFYWGVDSVPWEHRHAALDAALLICQAPSPNDRKKSWLSSWQLGSALEGYAAEVADGARLAALVLDDPKSLTWDTATVAATFACERGAPPADAAASPFATLVDGAYRSDAWTAWAALEERDQLGVAQLKKLSRSGALRDELRQAAAAGTPPHELARLARLYASIKKSERSHWPELVAPPKPLALDDNEWRDLSQWIPKALHGAAIAHLRHAPRAALVKALTPEVPDPRHLLSEQVALQERLSGAELSAGKRSAMEQRLSSLLHRLEAPEPIPPGTVAVIEERLCAGAIRARFRRWLTSLQAQILTDLPEPARACIDFAQDRQADVVIAHLHTLPTETRTLAYRLLSARAAPQPWDLRDDPANAAWREKAAENGLDLARWFSGEAFDVPPPDEGEPLIFRLEDDPLEVMKMGLWFDTCLSPGDMNFFSTIANAADANKRLLVGRDAKGTAQARCLFAITEQWHVLAFHVYGHERAKWIRSATKSALQSLCSSMGTTPAPRGKVSTIVARKWYDDGPQDVADQLASLGPGGELASRVAAAPDTDAFHIVSTELGTPVIEVALELILGCEVFLTSAARTASFAPLLRSRRWPRWFVFRLAQLLAVDYRDLALGLLRELCRGKSPARLKLDVHEALTLAKAFRNVGQPRQSLLVLRSQQGTYEADEIRRETALALKDLGRDDAAARVLGALA